MQFAPLYPLIYRVLQPLFPNCLWSGDPNSREIALTFDDGPHPSYTTALLHVLEKYDLVANFFWLGYCVDRAPQVARSVYQQGHWLGLHGYDHRNFPLLSPDILQQNLIKTQKVIAQACDLDPAQIRDVRPPNGVFTPKTLKLLHQWQYRPVMWSVVPEDWTRPGVSTVVERVMQQVQNGSIIVLHDGIHGGQDVAETAAQLVSRLLEHDYKFVTIETLWGYSTTKSC
jgi:peptidoglycan/xylan/chitin deacetylase (PgdA/CDA1 family)